MRLALIDPAPLRGERTESLQFLQLADALAAAGAEVRLLTPRAAGTAEILGRPVHPGLHLEFLDDPRHGLIYRLLGLSRSNKPFLARLGRWIAAGGLRDVDAVYVRNLKLAERLLATPGAPPLFFHAHEHFARVFREEHDLGRWRERRRLAALTAREGGVYRGAAGIVATVSPIVADIRADYGADLPALVVPNGVDLEAVRAVRADVAVRPAGRVSALYLGSLHPWKGVETVLRAMPRARSRVDLVIVGGEPHRVQELEQLARELGVADCVRLLGPTPPARRFEAIAAADLALLPLTARSGMASRYTSPLKLFEYMAMGKAILASDLPTVRDIVKPGMDAVLAAPDQPEAWADALLALAVDAPLRARLGSAAAAAASACGWEQRAATILTWMRGRL
ncbi:MAG: glycosyltransferase [Betaproteobacteria bacterium]|nr:glycosyltransferase [Betaproteobacteria bacterium]